jgi:hypothetical protein
MKRDGLQPDAERQKTTVRLDGLPDGVEVEAIEGTGDAEFRRVSFKGAAADSLAGDTPLGPVASDGFRQRFDSEGVRPWNLLARFAQAADLTPAELAERANCDPGDVLDFLDDRGEFPTEREQRRLAGAVGSTPAEVFPVELKPDTPAPTSQAHTTTRPPARTDFTPEQVELDAKRRQAAAELEAGRRELAEIRADAERLGLKQDAAALGRRVDHAQARARGDRSEAKQMLGNAIGRLEDLGRQLRGGH